MSFSDFLSSLYDVYSSNSRGRRNRRPIRGHFFNRQNSDNRRGYSFVPTNAGSSRGRDSRRDTNSNSTFPHKSKNHERSNFHAPQSNKNNFEMEDHQLQESNDERYSDIQTKNKPDHEGDGPGESNWYLGERGQTDDNGKRKLEISSRTPDDEHEKEDGKRRCQSKADSISAVREHDYGKRISNDTSPQIEDNILQNGEEEMTTCSLNKEINTQENSLQINDNRKEADEIESIKRMIEQSKRESRPLRKIVFKNQKKTTEIAPKTTIEAARTQ